METNFNYLLKSGQTWEPIPTTFTAAVNRLLKILSPETERSLLAISLEEVGWATHFSLGAAIRKNWKLWEENSVLRRQFPFKQPDDISYAIVEATWEKLELLNILIKVIKAIISKKT